MKKDKLIEKKLNDYANSIKPDEIIIYDAVQILKNNKDSVIFSKKRNYKAIPILLLSFVFIFINVYILNTLFSKNNTVENSDQYAIYQIQDLGRKNTDISQLSEDYNNLLLLDMPLMNVSSKEYFDRETQNVNVLALEYEVLSEYGMEEINIIIDINNGLQDFSSFKNYTYYEIDEKQIYKNEYYKNGEYYTNLYFENENMDYYIIIMSPENDRANIYLENLFI